jgi:hypothetical protein
MVLYSLEGEVASCLEICCDCCRDFNNGIYESPLKSTRWLVLSLSGPNLSAGFFLILLALPALPCLTDWFRTIIISCFLVVGREKCHDSKSLVIEMDGGETREI